MNHLITYDEAARFFQNLPSLAPCPDFTQKFGLFANILLKRSSCLLLECPQSMLHGWTGLAMDPTMYALLNPTPFFAPTDSGDVPVYPPFATPAAIKTINCQYKNTKNYFMSYVNISHELFRMLDKNIDGSLKVSNNTTLTGWNPTMSIQLILAQLEVSY
jgi:hypothetical protein